MAAPHSGRSSYTPEQRAEALSLYEMQGTTAASKATGIPKNTIQDWAKKAGIRTVRNTKTKAATEAATVDAAKTRALVVSKSITLTESMLDVIADRFKVEGHEVPLKDLATIMGIVADKHKMLAGMDKGNESFNSVDAWLDHITGEDQID